VARQTDQFHPVLCVADVGVADRRAGNFVQLAHPHLETVHAAGQPPADPIRVLQLGCVVAGSQTAAPDAEQVRTAFAFGPRQHHAHAGVQGIGPPNVLGKPGRMVRLIAVVQLLQRIDVSAGDRIGPVQQAAIGCLVLRVVRPGDHHAVGVQQFHHGVQAVAGAVHIEPDLRPRRGRKAVIVDIVAGVEEPFDLETQPQVVIAARLAGGQGAQELGPRRNPVQTGCRGVGRLQLQDDFHVAVVAVLVQPHAAPVAGLGRAANAVVVRVRLGPSVGLDTRANRVVVEGRQHHGEAGLS